MHNLFSSSRFLNRKTLPFVVLLAMLIPFQHVSADVDGITPTPTPIIVNDPTATPESNTIPTRTPVPTTAPTETPVPPTATPRPSGNSGQSSQPTATPTEIPPLPQDIPELGRGPTVSMISITLGFLLIISILVVNLGFAVYKASTSKQ